MLLQFAIKTFDLALALTGGGPGIATTFPAIYVYDLMFQRGQIAEGAAAAIMILLALAAVLVPYSLWSSVAPAPGERSWLATPRSPTIRWRHLAPGAARARKFGVYLLLGLFAAYYLLPLVVVFLNSFRDLQEIAAERPDRLSAQLLASTPGARRGARSASAAPARHRRNLLQLAEDDDPGDDHLDGDRRDQRLRPVEMAVPRLRAAVRGDDARRVHARADRLLPWAFIARQARPHQHDERAWCWSTRVQGLRFTTLFCRNYYVNIPEDLIKAARIDGAGFWRIFRKIILPLSPPILIVTVIWQFTGIWNEFLYAVVFTSGREAADHGRADRAVDQRHQCAQLRCR